MLLAFPSPPPEGSPPYNSHASDYLRPTQRALRDILMSRGKKLSPQCLETIFDLQLPSPKLSPKLPPKLSLPHYRGFLFLFQNYPRGEGNCETTERQNLSRGNFCPRDIKMSLVAHWARLGRTRFSEASWRASAGPWEPFWASKRPLRRGVRDTELLKQGVAFRGPYKGPQDLWTLSRVSAPRVPPLGPQLIRLLPP